MNCRLGLAFDRQTSPTAEQYRLQTRMISSLVEKAIGLTTSTPERVAREICAVIEMKNPPLRRQVTLDALVFSFMKRFMPPALFDRLIGSCLNRIRYQLEHAEFETPSPLQV
jgi:hypothetical protein